MDFESLKKIIKETLFTEGLVLLSKRLVVMGAVTSATYFSYDVATNNPDDFFDDDEEYITAKEEILDIKRKIKTAKSKKASADRSPASVRDSENNNVDLSGVNTSTRSKDFAENTAPVNVAGSGYYQGSGGGGGSATGYGQGSSSGSDYSEAPRSSSNNSNPTDNTETVTKTTDSTVSTEDTKAVVAATGNNTTTSEDTSDFTDVTNNNETRDNATALACSFDKAQGTYPSWFAVTLSCSEAASIKYCINNGSGFCDPQASPIDYTGPVTIGTADGNYGLSFYATADSSGEVFEAYNLSYIIDSTTPGLIVSFPSVNFQTTQLPFTNSTQSNNFGMANHYYNQINFKSHDPTASGLNWSCSDMFQNYGILTAPVATQIQNDFSIESLLSTSQIDQTVDMPKLAAGDNYIVTIIENKDNGLYSCQVQNVIVNDFAIGAFTATGSTSVVSGVRTSQGGFVSHGHFQATPNSSATGSSSNTQSSTVNQVSYLNITH